MPLTDVQVAVEVTVQVTGEVDAQVAERQARYGAKCGERYEAMRLRFYAIFGLTPPPREPRPHLWVA